MRWKRNIYAIAGVSDAMREASISMMLDIAQHGRLDAERQALRLYSEFLDEGRMPASRSGYAYIVREAARIVQCSPPWDARSKRLQGLMPGINDQEIEALQEAVMLLRDSLNQRAENERKEREHAQQSERGKKGAAVRWEANADIGTIVENLARQTDNIGDPLEPKDLWPLLHSALDIQGRQPRQTDEVCEFDGGRITYDTFARQLRRKRPPA